MTWTCASCHNGVQLFISHLARWLRACRFREPTFRPSEPQIIGTDDGWPKSVEEHVLSSIKDIAGESFIEDDADD